MEGSSPTGTGEWAIYIVVRRGERRLSDVNQLLRKSAFVMGRCALLGN